MNSFFASPASFQSSDAFAAAAMSPAVHMMYAQAAPSTMPFTVIQPQSVSGPGGGEAHASIGHLALLVFEAVLEVVCVAFPGYIIARCGMFDAEMQKFLANLNVSLFTPCLSELQMIAIVISPLTGQSISLYEAREPAYPGQDCRPRRYPCYLRPHDGRFICLFVGCGKIFPLREESGELCDCYGTFRPCDVLPGRT